MTNLWVDTHSNPADFPSRFKDIPPPDSSPFESVLLDPEAITAVQCDRPPSVQAMLEQEAQKLGSDPVLSEPIFGKSSNEPLLKSLHAFDGAAENEEPRRIFREIFAGKAGLSQAVAGFGVVDVAEPFDFKHGKHHRDILDDTVYEQLLVDASVPGQVWHFGLPCGSFSIIQHSNQGTRRVGLPQGNGMQEREVVGNIIVHRTVQIIGVLLKAGNQWTLENPRTSYAWLMPELAALLNHKDTRVCIFDQCAYGLRLKGRDGRYGPCKKNTKLAGNLTGLESLSKLCCCKVPHVHAIGGVKTKAGWKRRSELAGHYPKRLCEVYANLLVS